MLVKRNAQSLSMFVLAAGAALAAHCLGAAAGPAGGIADELRPMYASPEEIAEGKQLAETSCAGCHGADGISINDGVPNLAGQRPAYLYIEMKAYQSGARAYSAMNDTVKFLNDDAFVKLAAYFASLDPAQPSAPGARKANLDPVQAGKAAASACAGCHGETGASKTPGMPNLAGLDPKYLIQAMKAYQSGQRKNDLMKSMLAAASEADINNIALFYALQKPSRSQTSAPGDQAAGKAAAAACSGCHGEDGVSAIPTTPSLAGQDAQYLAAALRAYKDGSRSDETMKGLAAALDGNAVKNLPAFYASLQPKQPDVRKPLTTEEWTQRCDRCHGLNGNSIDPGLPELAAQRVEYLEKALHDYRTGARQSPRMAAMSSVLTELDVDNLAAHYAGQVARGVVFVPVPAK
ncbi:MAG: c-type cytochrome [Rhodomicrobium sp.]